MDTYGDMVTLLLCFFVLLYSMSTIDTDKWKALVQSFNPNAIPAATEIEGGNDGPSADSPGLSGVAPVPDEPLDQAEIEDMIKQLYESLQQYSQEEGLESTIQVEMSGGKIFVRFNQTAFFEPDKDKLLPAAVEVLEHVCEMLDQVAGAIDEIRFQGHTANPYNAPNEPSGDRFLASGRATRVLVYVQTHSSIHPVRLISEGYGQWRPIGDNKTNDGLAMNRRVEMVISGRDLEHDDLTHTIQQFFTDGADQAS